MFLRITRSDDLKILFTSTIHVLGLESSLDDEITLANGAGFDGFFGWILIQVLLDGWKRVTL